MKAPAKIGLSVALIDVLLWLVLNVLGSGYVGSSEGISSALLSLSSFWTTVHSPVEFLFLPYLIIYMPSHGGGWPALSAEAIYVGLCAAQVFAMAFFCTKIFQFFTHDRRNA